MRVAGVRHAHRRRSAAAHACSTSAAMSPSRAASMRPRPCSSYQQRHHEDGSGTGSSSASTPAGVRRRLVRSRGGSDGAILGEDPRRLRRCARHGDLGDPRFVLLGRHPGGGRHDPERHAPGPGMAHERGDVVTAFDQRGQTAALGRGELGAHRQPVTHRDEPAALPALGVVVVGDRVDQVGRQRVDLGGQHADTIVEGRSARVELGHGVPMVQPVRALSGRGTSSRSMLQRRSHRRRATTRRCAPLR